MKYIFKPLLILSAGAFLFAGTGCKRLENFADTNLNPNGSAAPITAALLTSAEVNLGRVVEGTNAGIRAAIYAQYISETQYTDVSTYSEPNVNYTDALSGDVLSTHFYAGPLENLQTIINNNTDPATKGSASAYGSNADQIAIAKILKAYIVWTITDRWGDVPYSEALQGAALQQPKYDKQADLYAALINDLKAGRDGFDGGTTVQGDVMYSGDETAWKKLANSIISLMCIRMSKVYPNASDFAGTEYAAAYGDANGMITSNADNFTLAYPGGSYKAPWFNLYDGRKDYGFSLTMYDLMNNMSDARVAKFGSNATAFPYGLKRDDAVAFDGSVNGNWARVLAADQRAENSPVVMINAASVLLGQAEAIERGWITGSSNAAYDAGVTASFIQWGLAGSAASYLAGDANFASGQGGGTGIGANAYGTIVGSDAVTSNKLQRIALQRYIAHYPDGIQGWSEWRRTGIPNLKPTAAATNSPGFQIPRRYVYSTSEYSLNPDQVAVAAGRLTGGDKMDSHIWWDN